MLRGEQALLCIGWIAGLEDLVAFCEIGGQPAGKIWTEGSSSSARCIQKHRSVADEFVGRDAILVRVIRLRQTPDIMVADVGMAAGGNAYLVVKSFRIVVPHFLQPIQTKFGFRREIRRGRARTHLLGKIANAYETQSYSV